MIDPSRLRAARDAKNWSQDDLAAAAKVSQQTIGKLETGTARTSKFIARIAAALGVSVSDLDPDFGSPAQEIASIHRVPEQVLGIRDLPVYSAVEGGPGELVVSTDPIDWVPRPWYLGEVRDGYAVVVTGESMVPVYEPGDIVIINPRLPAIRGKNAIFVSGEERGEFKATVKRLEKSTERDWHVRQFNPPEGRPEHFSLLKAVWPKALRIVGKFEG